MPGDEALQIDVQVLNGQQAQANLRNLAQYVSDIQNSLSSGAWTPKEMRELTGLLTNAANASRALTKVVDDTNKVNQQAALLNQKLATEVEKTTTAKRNSALASQKLATEVEKTTLMAQKNELQAVRNAQALEKMAQAAQKASEPYAQLRAQLSASENNLRNVFATGASVGDNGYITQQIAQYQELRRQLEHVQEQMKLAKMSAYDRANYGMQDFTNLTKDLRNYETELKNAIASGKISNDTLQSMGQHYQDLQAKVNSTNDTFKKLTNSIDDTNGMGAAFASFLGNTLSHIVIQATNELKNLVGQISQVGVEMDGIKNTFAAGARGLAEGGREMAWVSQMADELGLNLKGAYGPYAKFMTSFTRSGGTIAESRQIFEDLSTAMVSLHLNAQQMEGVFISLEQMANKGTVQSEELKRQLGQYLPGAFEEAAAAMGYTTNELAELMKKGEVISREFLPKFAARVRDSLGKQVGIAVDQYNAHFNRMMSETYKVQGNLGAAWNQITLPIIKANTTILSQISVLTTDLNKNAFAMGALQSAFIATGIGALSLAGKIPQVASALKVLNTEISLTTLSLNNFTAAQKAAMVKAGWIAAIMAAAAAVFALQNKIDAVNQSYAEMAFQQRDASNHITGLISEFAQLNEVTNRSTVQQAAYNTTLNTLETQYPTVLEYIRSHNINLKTLSETEANQIALLTVEAERLKALALQTEMANNKLQKFGAAAKIIGPTIALGFKAAVVGLANNISLATQMVGTAISNYLNSVATATRGTAAFLEKIPMAQGLSSSLAAASQELEKWGKDTRNWGKAWRQDMNAQLQIDAMKIVGLLNEPRLEADKVAAETISILGNEQQKIADNLLAAKNALTDFQKETKGKEKKGKTAKTQDDYEKFLQSIQEAERAMQITLLHGEQISQQSIDNYVALKEKQKEIEEGIKSLTTAQTDRWKQLTDEINKTHDLIAVQELEGGATDELKKKYQGLVAQRELVNKNIEALIASGKSSWDVLENEIQQTEKLLRVQIYEGTVAQELVARYQELTAERERVNKAMQDITGPAKKEISLWKQIEQEAKKASETYKSMLSNSLKYTEAEIKAAKSRSAALNNWVQYNSNVEKASSLMEITAESAKDLASTLVDDLLTPLKEGETIWSRFKDAGIEAIKAIATTWIKNRGSLAIQGAQVGWEQNLSGNKWISALLGFGSGVEAAPIEGTGDNPTYGRNGGKWNGAFDRLQELLKPDEQDLSTTVFTKLTEQSTLLGDSLDTNLLPKTSEILSSFAMLKSPSDSLGESFQKLNTSSFDMANNLMGVQSIFTGLAPTLETITPTLTTYANLIKESAIYTAHVATAVVEIGAAAPSAASGLSAIGVAMKECGSVMQQMGPSMAQAASSLSSFATSAAEAAVSAAELAVSSAASSVAKIPYAGGFLAPIAAVATGASIAGGAAMATGALHASNAVSGGGKKISNLLSNLSSGISGMDMFSSIIPHAKGGIVNSPTMFPMSGGNVGLAGEAGMEVIAPARRMANGDVGIGAVAPNVTINNYTNAAVEVIKRPNDETEVRITELNAMLSSSRTNRGFGNAQQRMYPGGKQVG